VVVVVAMLVTPEGLAARVVVTVRAILVVAVVEVQVAHSLQVGRAAQYKVQTEPPLVQVERAHSIKAAQPELVIMREVPVVTDITEAAAELVIAVERLTAPMVAVVVQGI
jgi:hypothetical protein